MNRRHILYRPNPSSQMSVCGESSPVPRRRALCRNRETSVVASVWGVGEGNHSLARSPIQVGPTLPLANATTHHRDQLGQIWNEGRTRTKIRGEVFDINLLSLDTNVT